MHQLENMSVTRGLMILAIYMVPTMAKPIRGNNLESATIPFVASIAIKIDGSREHHASGALIAEDLVLTAAHCIEGFTHDMMDVVLGFADLKYANPRYEIDSWITFKEWATKKHPNFSSDDPDDVALIKLKHRVRGVLPANITTLKVDDLYGKNISLVGWTAGRNGQPRFMKTAKVQILKLKECEYRTQLENNPTNWIPDGLICTVADPFALLTPGDSGGPLLDGNKVILAINKAVCIGKLNATEKFIDEQRFNTHTYFLDKYRLFIEEMKANWPYMTIY